MPKLTTQSDLRGARDLPFCHVCGSPFLPGDQSNYDHVPAKACFDKVDRNPPLKLKSHVSCNNDHKLNDEKVGELLAVRRLKSIHLASRLRISFVTETGTGRIVGASQNLDLIGCIKRWIGGFHAALYGEALPPETLFQITPPLPHAVLSQHVEVVPLPDHVSKFVHTLKLNRAARNLDRIVTNNGKMQYECVWAREDQRSIWLCIWALDIYNWVGLGDRRFGSRGCTGAYILNSGQPPKGAAIATRIEVSIPNRDPFDAFGI